MEIGLFFQLPVWPEQRADDRYEETLRQIELADRLGFQVAWLAELHFEANYGVMPSPFLVAAAATQRTQRIGIGTAVSLLPLHDPLRLAEETAMLDQLSRGRLRLGVGRGSIPQHYAGFGRALDERQSRFEESLEIVRRAWGPEPFSFTGAHFSYENVNVVPKPLQQPHPPLLMAANSDESVETAIALDIPVMMSTLTATPDQISARSRRYRSARPNAPAGDIALMAPVHVAESNELAERDAEASHLSYYREVARVIRAGLTGNPDGSTRRVPLAERFGSITFEESITSDSAVGDPDRVVERLTALHDCHGFGHLMAWFAFGGRIPHERVLASMRLFADEVAPRLP
ncbi:MAG: Flavin-dependent oxidoreductase, luciferase family [Chloroflexi bacterium]|jgi:alkanesulfonate monooxygenase SsuD/methylene tetrahydromethanopterin reductase-like flavin-dependent oxidoreductase (luciferase family)|nr:MAG: Flavin-dependent oxidoreductase, luciferase family [Chloroflexota bacterium]